DAQAGRNPGASLDEAASILDTARGDLPADHSAPDWQRWTRDEATLDSLRRSLAPASGGPGSGPAAPSAGDDGPQGGSGDGDDGHPSGGGISAPGATPDGH